MNWITGIRGTTVYQIQKRPLDPRWSNRDIHMALSWCCVGQHLGWSETRAFQAAEAMIMAKKHHGILWPSSPLTEDMQILRSISDLSGTTLNQEE
jgi:hypothetical protein